MNNHQHRYFIRSMNKALIAAYNELVATMDNTFKRIDIIAEEVEKLRADNIDGANPELN